MSTTLTHLENKITELQKFGEQLAMSMEGAAVRTNSIPDYSNSLALEFSLVLHVSQ